LRLSGERSGAKRVRCSRGLGDAGITLPLLAFVAEQNRNTVSLIRREDDDTESVAARQITRTAVKQGTLTNVSQVKCHSKVKGHASWNAARHLAMTSSVRLFSSVPVTRGYKNVSKGLHLSLREGHLLPA
jgi:hypothetical protein